MVLLQAEVRLAIGTHCIWLWVCSKCLSSTCDQCSSHDPWWEHKSQPKHSTFEASDNTTPTHMAVAKASHVTKVCRGGTYVCPREGHWLQICQLSQWGCQNSPPLMIRCQTFEYNANCYKIRLPNLLEALSHKINKNNVREQFRSHTDTSLWHHLLSTEEKRNIDHDTITNSQRIVWISEKGLWGNWCTHLHKVSFFTIMLTNAKAGIMLPKPLLRKMIPGNPHNNWFLPHFV